MIIPVRPLLELCPATTPKVNVLPITPEEQARGARAIAAFVERMYGELPE